MRDNGFNRAQAQYEAMTPPDEGPDYPEDCWDGSCGECYPCINAAEESAIEDAADARLNQWKEEGF